MQVTEYARLTTDQSAKRTLGCGVVSDATFVWLQELNKSWKGSEPIALIESHQHLKLGSYVGYLQSPSGESIEILPKTTLGVEKPALARKILQEMLKASLGIPFRQAGTADLMRLDQPLHEWIYQQFLHELNVLIHRGLRFDYEQVEEEIRTVRGQLLLQRQCRRPPGRDHMFDVRYDLFTPNRIENRLLKTALSIVQSQCRSPENWRLSHELANYLVEVPPVVHSELAFASWQHTKIMQNYEPVKPWCQLIIEQLNPNFQKGSHKGIALLFPMEVLFERYVEACLRKCLSKRVSLTAQASSQHLLTHQPEASCNPQSWFQLKPDLLLRLAGEVQVLDAKWKLINQFENTSLSKYSIKQADLYQLFAYGQKYQNGRGHMMMIYPKHEVFQQPLPCFQFTETLTLWVVPFCLESRGLESGDWQPFFPLEALGC